MAEAPLSQTIKTRLKKAARMLGATNPVNDLSPSIDRAFALPEGDARYAVNNLTPGTAAFEPSFSEQEPGSLRFTMEPLGPDALPINRRDEATRDMRRLVGENFGREAVRWFDQRSEEWRTMFMNPRLNYGAWFGTSYDRDGLKTSKVYYELNPNQLAALPAHLHHIVRAAMHVMPTLMPIFTSIMCQRENGNQRVTFVHRHELQLADLQPLMEHLGMAHQLPSVMQVLGLALGGRFSLPSECVLVGLGGDSHDPELKIYVLLGMRPDLPPSFLNLLGLGLSERPRELRGLERWLAAYTPEWNDWPGDFSVLSVRVTRHQPARIGLYLRPIEFEISHRLQEEWGGKL